MKLKNLFLISFFFTQNLLAAGYYNLGAMSKKRDPLTFSLLGSANTFSNAYYTIVSNPRAGRGDGMLSSPSSITIDATYLYVLDAGNFRISRYTKTSGAFAGWIGRVGKTPTGGDAGCSTAPVNSFTPGWCTGGEGSSGTGDGMFRFPGDINNDGTSLYVLDGNRVSKFTSSTGAFVGWIGQIGISPTSGAAGCAGAAVGTITPGWCKGGESADGAGDGGFTSSSSLAVGTSGYVFVPDGSSGRILKYNASTGAFVGWIGQILTSPTGGDSGCIGATVGTFTPGWCIGGSSEQGDANTGGAGALGGVTGIAVDGSGNLYAADASLNKLNRYTIATGAFTGWIGIVSGGTPTGGDAGCTATSSGSTPGWCIGGKAGLSGSGATKALWQPRRVAIDSSGNIYVSTFQGFKKFTNTTSYVGYKGVVFSTPTGGTVAACTSTTNGNFTPGWCIGSSIGILGVPRNGSGIFTSSATFAVDTSGDMFLVDVELNRVIKFNSTTGAFISNLSAVSSGGASSWQSSNVGIYGTSGDGTIAGVGGAVADATYLYVTDTVQFRINRFFLSTGVFDGWIGYVASTPTGGDAGCSSAAANTFTPGWCKGGSSQAGTTTGNGGVGITYSITIDSSGSLYVADASNHRVLKFTASSGAFVGWIGGIVTSPTGGVVGCNGATGYTPGWCTGGTSAFGSTDGKLSLTNGGAVTVDTIGNLYVSDINNHRMVKYNASTGAYIGWIGLIGTSPTGGASGCNGASVDTVTPGWCTGGLAKSGNNAIGGVSFPAGLTVNNGNLYVATSSYINRYSTTTGAFTGWNGTISAVPTGGDPGCTVATIGGVTPGWCTGGTYNFSGIYNSPKSIIFDRDGFMYVTNSFSQNVYRFHASRPGSGWIGAIATTPTGGGHNCKGARPGAWTPSWCTGGTSPSQSLTSNGFSYPYSLAYSSTTGYLYIFDNRSMTRVYIH